MAEQKPSTNNNPSPQDRDGLYALATEYLKAAENTRTAESAKSAKSAKSLESAKAAKSARAAESSRAAGKKHGKSRRPLGCLNTVLAVVATVFFALVALAVYSQVSDSRANREENASLQELAEALEADASQSESSAQYVSAFDVEMRRINPDYLCWIRIEDTIIDYPVVRGDDNDKYLNLSFFGENNSLGTLFMDYRCIGDNVPHIIIYGHNSRLGDMFGSLSSYLDEQYMAEHPVITLIANDQITEYEIFSARSTTVEDPAYFIDFSAPGSFAAFAERCGAPPGASQILTLSTCVSGYDRDERVIVQGVLR